VTSAPGGGAGDAAGAALPFFFALAVVPRTAHHRRAAPRGQDHPGRSPNPRPGVRPPVDHGQPGPLLAPRARPLPGPFRLHDSLLPQAALHLQAEGWTLRSGCQPQTIVNYDSGFSSGRRKEGRDRTVPAKKQGAPKAARRMPRPQPRIDPARSRERRFADSGDAVRSTMSPAPHRGRRRGPHRPTRHFPTQAGGCFAHGAVSPSRRSPVSPGRARPARARGARGTVSLWTSRCCCAGIAGYGPKILGLPVSSTRCVRASDAPGGQVGSAGPSRTS